MNRHLKEYWCQEKLDFCRQSLPREEDIPEIMEELKKEEDEWIKNCKPKYSGPGKTGICICGHSWEDHHRSCVMNKRYIEATNEIYVLGECCAYGSNEFGGRMPGPDGEEGEWIDHCHNYQDSGGFTPE